MAWELTAIVPLINKAWCAEANDIQSVIEKFWIDGTYWSKVKVPPTPNEQSQWLLFLQGVKKAKVSVEILDTVMSDAELWTEMIWDQIVSLQTHMVSNIENMDYVENDEIEEGNDSQSERSDAMSPANVKEDSFNDNQLADVRFITPNDQIDYDSMMIEPEQSVDANE